MTPAAVLEALAAAGVHAALQGGGTVRLNAALPPPPEMLALARAHRNGIAALLAERAQQAARVGWPTFPGVPGDWCEGVARLSAWPAPATFSPHRWTALAATAARLLRDHGAELHAANWDALDVFGLHATAPAANPSGWGLAWLLGEHGDVLDVAPGTVGMRRYPDGARLAYRRRSAMARAGTVPAWRLDEVPA